MGEDESSTVGLQKHAVNQQLCLSRTRADLRAQLGVAEFSSAGGTLSVVGDSPDPGEPRPRRAGDADGGGSARGAAGIDQVLRERSGGVGGAAPNNEPNKFFRSSSSGS